ncbi:MAG: FAD-dependent oxidoreductase [Pirellulaceae bacterium]
MNAGQSACPNDNATHNDEDKNTRSTGSIVVVGGGIIGMACAWYLTRAGWSVTVLDRKTIGGACSHGNCGLICPSHVLPLTEPGAFKIAIKSLLTPNSPFRIKPRMDPALWSWLWNFSRRCNHSSMILAAHGIQALLASGMHEYEQWISVEGMDCEWQHKGLLFAYNTPRELEAYSSTNDLLAEHFNEPARRLDAAESVALEPALKESIAGSWYYEHDAHLRPDKLVHSMRQLLESQGCCFVEHANFSRIVSQGRDALRIETDSGPFTADAYLFASGAWTPLLRDQLGCYVPIQPGKGYSITMPRPTPCADIPLIFPEHRVAVTPMLSGYRLGSIMEFAGYDESIRPERLQLLRDGAAHYLRQPAGASATASGENGETIETWYGWRPMTYDGLPVIDRSPAWNNVWIAAGHNMLGLSMAPSTGRLVSELISEHTPHLDPTPYRASRFKTPG